MFSNALDRFRVISAIEGLSFIVLVFIAMPIKYLGDNPLPVRICGMTHGILFILFMLFLFDVKRKLNWNIGLMFQIFVLSLIPFGALLIERIAKRQSI